MMNKHKQNTNLIYAGDTSDGNPVSTYEMIITKNECNDQRIEMEHYKNDFNWAPLVSGSSWG